MSAELVIKVAIADDHKIFRDGIKMALKDKDYLKIIWEAEDGRDLVHKMLLKKPDVLLMDIRMPEVDGINAIGILRKEYEEVKIIVLTMYDDQEMISKMMEMGANAYLTKTTDPEEIYQAILACMNDDFYFNDLVNKAVLSKLQTKRQVRQFYPDPIKFSEKEVKILRLLAQDKTTEEISKEVFLSPRTIETMRVAEWSMMPSSSSVRSCSLSRKRSMTIRNPVSGEQRSCDTTAIISSLRRFTSRRRALATACLASSLPTTEIAQRTKTANKKLRIMA